MQNKTIDQAQINSGIRKRFRQVIVITIIQILILFLSAGRWDWGMAWLLLAVNLSFFAINSILLLRKDPSLIAERAHIREDAKQWDRPLAGIVSFYGPQIILLVAGLDERNGWSPDLSLTVQLIALLAALLGYLLWGWAMNANRFFAGLVRIQKERGHTVATGGPYRFVRHPGYAGMLIFTPAIALTLDSLWALIPAGLTLIALLIRTVREDQTLQAELPGYQAYAQKVHYRLIPGIW